MVKSWPSKVIHCSATRLRLTNVLYGNISSPLQTPPPPPHLRLIDRQPIKSRPLTHCVINQSEHIQRTKSIITVSGLFFSNFKQKWATGADPVHRAGDAPPRFAARRTSARCARALPPSASSSTTCPGTLSGRMSRQGYIYFSVPFPPHPLPSGGGDMEIP